MLGPLGRQAETVKCSIKGQLVGSPLLNLGIR